SPPPSLCTKPVLFLPGWAVHSYLGKSLDKKHQTSSWARRPLKESQMNYAACDALGA
ncbi:unnamed protein product, partial [Laminaria digitata]